MQFSSRQLIQELFLLIRKKAFWHFPSYLFTRKGSSSIISCYLLLLSPKKTKQPLQKKSPPPHIAHGRGEDDSQLCYYYTLLLHYTWNICVFIKKKTNKTQTKTRKPSSAKSNKLFPAQVKKFHWEWDHSMVCQTFRLLELSTWVRRLFSNPSYCFQSTEITLSRLGALKTSTNGSCNFDKNIFYMKMISNFRTSWLNLVLAYN